MGASSFSPSPMTTMPSIDTPDRTARMASTAAPSADSLSPRPIQRAAAMAAASVTRTSSMPRLRSGTSWDGLAIVGSSSGTAVGGSGRRHYPPPALTSPLHGGFRGATPRHRRHGGPLPGSGGAEVLARRAAPGLGRDGGRPLRHRRRPRRRLGPPGGGHGRRRHRALRRLHLGGRRDDRLRRRRRAAGGRPGRRRPPAGPVPRRRGGGAGGPSRRPPDRLRRGAGGPLRRRRGAG